MSILVHRRLDFLSGLVGIPQRVLGFVAHVCEIASVSVEKKAQEVDMERMKQAAFRERIERYSDALKDACTTHNLTSATHRNLEIMGGPVDESLAVTCEPFRSL